MIHCEYQNKWLRQIGTMLALGLTLCSISAHGTVRLENAIKKVESYVNPQGDVERKMVEAARVVPGDELQYTITFTNDGTEAVDAGTVVITDHIPPDTQYIEGTAFGAGTAVQFSVDGEVFAEPDQLVVTRDGKQVVASAKDYTAIRWNFSPELKPGSTGWVSFNVRLK